MHYKSYMPTRDSEFIPWAKNIKEQSVTNQTLWGLNIMQVEKLTNLTDDAESAWEANSNPATTNRQSSAMKKFAFSELKHFLSLFTDSFYVNDAISDADIATMGLRPRHTHASQPKPEPDEAPEVTAVVGQHHDVTIYVSKAQHGEPVRSLNTKYRGFAIRYRKEGETEWHQQLSTSLHATLYFETEDEGKHLSFAVAWLNARLQHGPWSDEVSSLIN